MSRGLLSGALALALLGCPQPGDDDDATAPPGTECDDGYVDDGGTCVPEACGAGTWGDLALPDDAVYVHASAADGGDGGEDAPLATIQGGLDRAAELGASAVAVGAGTYVENVELGSEHDGIALIGRCADLVVLDGSPDPDYPALLSIVAGGAFEASGITFTGSQTAGVWRVRGALTLRDVLVTGNLHRGVAAEGAAELSIEDSTIRDTADTAEEPWGYGLVVFGMGSAVVRRSVIEGNTRIGVLISDGGTEALLEDVVVASTRADAELDHGYGIEVRDGAQATVVGGTVERNTTLGVIATGAGSRLELDGVLVRDTLVDHEGLYGRGARVEGGAALVARDTAFENNVHTGIKLTGAGTTADLDNVIVSDTRSNDEGLHGGGIYVFDGAALTATGCTIERNMAVGLQLNEAAEHPDEAATSAHLVDCVVRDTVPDGTDQWGYGVQLSDGASLTLDGCLLERNTGVGLTVSGEGSAATLVDTDIRETQLDRKDVVGFALQAFDGGDATITGGVFDDNVTVGLVAVGEGTEVAAEGLAIRDTQPTEEGFGRGIEVLAAAHLTLVDAVIEDNTEAGLMASGYETLVELERVAVRGTQRGSTQTTATGVACELDATVIGVDVALEQNEGPGLFSLLGELHCTGCTSRDNRFAGAAVLGHGSMELRQCTLEGNGSDANTGGGVGVYAWDTDIGFWPRVVLEDSTIADHPLAAVWLDGPGSYALTGNDLEGGWGAAYQYPNGDSLLFHGNAVYATDRIEPWDPQLETGLLLDGNLLHDGAGAAVMLHGASATLQDDDYDGNLVDLQQQACGEVPIPEGHEEAPAAVLCPQYDAPVEQLRFLLQHAEAAPQE